MSKNNAWLPEPATGWSETAREWAGFPRMWGVVYITSRELSHFEVWGAGLEE